MAVDITPIRRWKCPNCKATSITKEARPHTRFHSCVGLRGLAAPFIEEGVRVQVSINEREDYQGDDILQLDENGRPAMAVTTEYQDGRKDVAVYAPAATATGDV